MKKLITLIFTVSSIVSLAQTLECNCDGPLSEDLTTKFKSTEYRKLKEFLYDYFKSDATTQTSMKHNTSFNWTSNASAFVEGLPIKGQGDAAYSNSNDDQTFVRLSQAYLKNTYLSDEQFNQVVAEQMGDNQLDGYKACLELCKITSGNGVTYNLGGDFNDELSIRVNFNSTTGGKWITIKGEPLCSNLEPIGGSKFKAGDTIFDRQSVTHFFKRLDPNKSAMFSFNVNENIAIKAIDFTAKPPVNTQQVPIGTIISSVLSYDAFLEANGFLLTTDMSKAVWIPCDGRTLNGSKYKDFGTVPDLRGLFLRGVNDYGVSYPNVGIVKDDHKNTESKNAGDFQNDAFEKHHHDINYYRGVHWDFPGTTNAGAVQPLNAGQGLEHGEATGNAGEATETRPRNISVYYYIKINN